MKSEKQTARAAPRVSPRAVSATVAARTFSDLLNRVQYRGERFIIERGGHPVGELCPATPRVCTGADLKHLLATLPHADAAFGEDVVAAVHHQPLVEPSRWVSEDGDES